MQEPTFKPGTWVVFSADETGGFGEIIGGAFNGTEWLYHVANATLDGGRALVHSQDITYTFEGGNWMKPNFLTGNSSVYAQIGE